MEITASVVALVLEAAPDALVGADADGRVVLANRRAEQLFGHGRDDLLKMPLDALLPDAPRVPAFHDRASAPGQPSITLVVEQSARRGDGSAFPAEVAVSFAETPQGPLVIASVRDMARDASVGRAGEIEVGREAALGQRGASLRLQNLGHLALGAAHDFNNMLSVILNYTGFVIDLLARTDLKQADLDEARRDLGQALLAAEQAAVLTRQLLTFGRRGIGGREALSVNDVIEGIEQLLRSLGAQTEPMLLLSQDLPPIEADPGYIEQLVVDLAIRARGTRRDGVLQIQTDAIEAGEIAVLRHLDLRPGPYLRLRVSGSGEGALSTRRPSSDRGDTDLDVPRALASQAGGVFLLDSDAGGNPTMTVLWPASVQAQV